MTRYEYLQNLKDETEKKARETQDVSLKAFYHHASMGYAERMKLLSVSEAGREMK